MGSGERPGLQSRRVASSGVTGGFDPHSLPPVFMGKNSRFSSSFMRARSAPDRCDRSRRCAKGFNLPDLELAVGPRWSPVHLLATPLASLLAMHRELWRSGI